jgi:hypothetical protein
MENYDAKNYLFFVGRNRFIEYFLNPFNELVVMNNKDNNNEPFSLISSVGVTINAVFNLSILYKKQQIGGIINSYPETRPEINLSLSLTGTNQSTDITVSDFTFTQTFLLNRLTLPDNINITCQFVIIPSIEDGNKFNFRYDNYKIEGINENIDAVFVSDLKESQYIAGVILSPLTNYNITTPIYVLPCLHELYKGYRDGITSDKNQDAKYNYRNTDCRKDEKDYKNPNLSFYSRIQKLNIETGLYICDRIVIKENEINIKWDIYNNFYADGYRDQNKRGRRLCRESNFLGIFFDNFVVNARRIGEGGKKYRKSRKLRRSRKSRKHKSRKYKSRK